MTIGYPAVSQARLDRFRECGSGLWLARSGDDLKLTCNKCRDRFCAACGAERAATVRNSIQVLAHEKSLRMITLTLRHSNTPLKDQLRRLRSSFKELRRRQVWKEHVQGGVGFIELKISATDGLWHVHFHILAQGSFFPHALLSREWLAVTGDSSIVHLGRKGTPEAMGFYAAKYCTKPADKSVYENPGKLLELVQALKGERLYNCFGTWRGIELEPEDPSGDWHPVDSINNLQRRAREGDEEAQRWWEAVLRKWPRLEPLNGSGP